MNDWYIDRSKNFIYDTLLDCLKLFNEASKDKYKLDVNDLIYLIKSHPELNIAEGNINAALTRFRDHGLLRNNNIIGDSAKDYVEGRLSESELIIDLFLKRPATKHDSADIKPFVILCKVFDIMMDMVQDIDDIFITSYECKEYLCGINDINDITYDYVEKIIDERDYSLNVSMPTPRITFGANEDTNFSIWFNALNNTPIFIKNENSRMILKPNIKQKEFFKYISINSDEMTETPTDSKKSLYEYYCNRNTGLNEILPSVIKKDINEIDENDVPAIFEYLFGYKKNYDVNFQKYFNNEWFGIFFPFITMPGLVIRKIYYENKKLGDLLYNYISNGFVLGNYIKIFYNGQFEISKKSHSTQKMFKNWLVRKQYRPKTIRNYLAELLFISKEAMEDNLVTKSIYEIVDLHELNSLIDKLNHNDKFNERKITSHNTNTAVLEQYKNFVSKIKEGETVDCMLNEKRITGAYNMIYFGTPGCGKSYLVNKDFNDQEYMVYRTTFHPEYSNSDFVGQIIPKTEEDEIKYKFQEGPFSIALLNAIKNPTKKVCLIIEEINRGNASAIFGDIFQLLDRDSNGTSIYSIVNESIRKYLYEKDINVERISIPSNLWIIATMNTSDQNIFTLDTAFKRRWRMHRIINKFKDEEYDRKLAKMYIPGSSYTWEQFVTEINKEIMIKNPTGLNSEDKQLGVYFVTENELSFEPINNSEDVINKFVEKVLLYIWDDVAKMDPDLWFGENIKSFDNLVDEYYKNNLKVFKDMFKDQTNNESQVKEENEENI